MLNKAVKKVFIALLVLTMVLPFYSFTSIKTAQSRQITVVIDPGHGGRDNGAVGPTGLKEKTVNLKVALRLRRYLVNSGVRVIMTRSTDKYLSLSQRVSIANKAKADRYIAIHHNWSRKRRVNGTETYIKRNSSSRVRDLGRKVQSMLVSKMGLSNRGLKYANFFVIKYTKMPSILTEASFVSNRKEEARLKSASWQDKEARGIFNGLKNHMRFQGSDSLALSGTISPAQNLYFPNVVDKRGVWNTFIAIKNISTSSRTIDIKLLNTSGQVAVQTAATIAPDSRYLIFPKKILRADFDGAVAISTTDGSLTGYLSQSNIERSTLGLSEPVTPNTNLSLPRVSDTSKYWRSVITVQNTSDINNNDVTVQFYSGGVLTGTKILHLRPLQNYDFMPRKILGSDFNGLVKFTSAGNYSAMLTQNDINNKTLALMPAQPTSQEMNFPYVKDTDDYYQSNVALANVSDTQVDYTVKFIDNNGQEKKEKIYSLSANQTYLFKPRDVVGADFYGTIEINSPSSNGSARLMMFNNQKTAIGLEGYQSPSQNNYYPYVLDEDLWSSIISIRNTGSSQTALNINLYNNNGTLYKSYPKALGTFQGYNFSEKTINGLIFTGPVTILGTGVNLTSTLIQTN